MDIGARNSPAMITPDVLRELVNKLGDRPYNMTVQIYTENAYIPPARNCFAFMFTNVGDTTATIQGMVIFPSATPLTALGDSRTISGHWGDVYTGKIDLSFRAPVGATPAVEVVQLYYV